MANRLVAFAIVMIALAARAAADPAQEPTLTGIAAFRDGKPAAGATIAINDADTGRQIEVVAADANGHYAASLPDGTYALTVTHADGFAWVAKQKVPDVGGRTELDRDCVRLVGHVDGDTAHARVHLEHYSFTSGDLYVAAIDADHRFHACLPIGQYEAWVAGELLSRPTTIDLEAPTSVQLPQWTRADVTRPPPPITGLRADLRTLVDAVIASDPQVIGLGEATHGTAEMTSARGELLFELIRRARVRLLLFEFDAIAGADLDDFIQGGAIDLDKALPALGFWITDTAEFRKFLVDLRKINQSLAKNDKVHLWGVDVQDTTLPVNALLAHASALGITEPQKALLHRLDKRGKRVRDLAPSERAEVDALLTRLGQARSTAKPDVLDAVAARSLAIQLGYWDGDTPTWYSKRRDLGMAELSRFIAAQSGHLRAALWAHDAHVAKDPLAPALGTHLARSLRYYAIGFYIHQGSARAWDEASKIGVILHPIPVAPAYTVEGAIMRAAGMPSTAWVALDRAPAALTQWLATPRYVREMGHTYRGEEAMLDLYDVRAGFDAIAVVRVGHDSTPSPTGVRVAKP
jgi:erythromycin esterase